MTDLVRHDGRNSENMDCLRAQIAELEAALDQRADEVAQLKADLHLFKVDYRREIGALYDQLDELEIAIADAELRVEIAARRDRSRQPNAPASAAAVETGKFTSDAIRKLFRDVAKAVHPGFSPATNMPAIAATP